MLRDPGCSHWQRRLSLLLLQLSPGTPLTAAFRATTLLTPAVHRVLGDKPEFEDDKADGEGGDVGADVVADGREVDARDELRLEVLRVRNHLLIARRCPQPRPVRQVVQIQVDARALRRT